MGTLRGAADGMVVNGLVGTLRTDAGMAGLAGGEADFVVPRSTTMSCWRAALWLSVNGANGELVDGLHNAVVMLAIPAKMSLVDEAVGMEHLVVNQVSMSQMHCEHISISK